MHLADAVGFRHHHAILFGLDPALVALPERKLGKEALVLFRILLPVDLRIDIAHKVIALGAVAVFHGEADAVQRQANAAPGPVEGFSQLQSVAASATAGVHQLGALGLGVIARQLRLRARVLDPKTHHQPAQEFRFQFGIRGTGLPHGRVLALGLVDFDHAPMTDVNLGRAGLSAALQAGAELVALPCRIYGIDHLAEQVAYRIIGDLGAVLGPVGLHHPDLGQFRFHQKTQPLPELPYHRPDFFRSLRYHQPALGASTLDAHLGHVGQELRGARAYRAAALGVVGGQSRRTLGIDVGHGVSVVARGGRQVRRYLQSGQLARSLVFYFFTLEDVRHAAAASEQCEQDEINDFTLHTALPSIKRRPLFTCMPAWRMASLTICCLLYITDPAAAE